MRAERINILWSKTFEVADGVSNVAALVENPNFYYSISATYNIRTFDNKGFRINDFSRKISLKPGEKRLIFIPGVKTAGAKIVKTFIKIVKINSITKERAEEKKMIVTSKTVSYEDGQTRLTVGLKNNSLEPLKNIEVVGVLSRPDGEVLDVAKTFLEYLDKRAEKKVFMTWQKEVRVENLKIDVYLREVDISEL